MNYIQRYIHRYWCRCSLFTWSKWKWLFWRTGFFPANQSFL